MVFCLTYFDIRYELNYPFWTKGFLLKFQHDEASNTIYHLFVHFSLQ